MNSPVFEKGADFGGVQLSEEVGMYVDRLRAEHDSIDAVWLVGDRVNAEDARETPWELLVFADGRTLQALRNDRGWRRDDIALSVVTDGDRFEPVWNEGGAASTFKGGSLRALSWRADTAQTATYTSHGDAGIKRRALRVR
jgi:hypothetical protein